MSYMTTSTDFQFSPNNMNNETRDETKDFKEFHFPNNIYDSSRWENIDTKLR